MAAVTTLPQPTFPAAPAASVVVECPVFYDAERLDQDRRAARGHLIGRVVSLLLSAAISGAFYFFFLKDAGAFGIGLLVVGLLIPLQFLVRAIARYVRVRRVAALAGSGLALGVTRAGLLVGGVLWAWPELDVVQARPRAGGDGELYVHTVDGRNAVWPLRYLTLRPAALDATVRALSQGRRRVDFAPLGA